jgi:hypothetical protein
MARRALTGDTWRRCHLVSHWLPNLSVGERWLTAIRVDDAFTLPGSYLLPPGQMIDARAVIYPRGGDRRPPSAPPAHVKSVVVIPFATFPTQHLQRPSSASLLVGAGGEQAPPIPSSAHTHDRETAMPSKMLTPCSLGQTLKAAAVIS